MENLYQWQNNYFIQLKNIVTNGQIAHSIQFRLLPICFQFNLIVIHVHEHSFIEICHIFVKMISKSFAAVLLYVGKGLHTYSLLQGDQLKIQALVVNLHTPSAVAGSTIYNPLAGVTLAQNFLEPHIFLTGIDRSQSVRWIFYQPKVFSSLGI